MFRPPITNRTKCLREKFAANRSFSDSWDMTKHSANLKLGKTDRAPSPTISVRSCFTPYTDIPEEGYTHGSLLNLTECPLTAPAVDWSPSSSTVEDDGTKGLHPLRKAPTEPNFSLQKTGGMSSKREKFQTSTSVSTDTGLAQQSSEPEDISITDRSASTRSVPNARPKVDLLNLPIESTSVQQAASNGQAQINSPPPYKESKKLEDGLGSMTPPKHASSRKSSASKRDPNTEHIPKPCGFDRPLITVCFNLTPSSTPTSSKRIAYDASIASSQAQWNPLRLIDDLNPQFLVPTDSEIINSVGCCQL
ncbi:Uncharacterised protein r2_g4169 [Pycnogonum litorale]